MATESPCCWGHLREAALTTQLRDGAATGLSSACASQSRWRGRLSSHLCSGRDRWGNARGAACLIGRDCAIHCVDAFLRSELP